jgi:hypothetical protein
MDQGAADEVHVVAGVVQVKGNGRAAEGAFGKIDLHFKKNGIGMEAEGKETE